MSYWKKQNEDWAEKSPDIEIIDHNEYLDVINEEGEFLYSSPRKLYGSDFERLTKTQFLSLIEILDKVILHPEEIVEFRETLEILERKGLNFIKNAIDREEKLRENCHRGGRKGQIWRYISRIQDNPENKFNLIEEAKQHLSRASVFRILKETKDIQMREPTFEERIERVKMHPDYLALILDDVHLTRLEQCIKIAFDRKLS